MLRVIAVYVGVLICAVIHAAILSWEAIGVAVLMSPVVVPSILVYVVVERFAIHRRSAKHVAYLLSLLPWSGFLLYVVLVGGEGKAFAEAFGYFYAAQAIVAYILLLSLQSNCGKVSPTRAAMK